MCTIYSALSTYSFVGMMKTCPPSTRVSLPPKSHTDHKQGMECRQLFKRLGCCCLSGSACFLIAVAICLTCLVIFTRDKHSHDFPNIADTGKACKTCSRHSLSKSSNPFSSPDVIKNNLWLQYANFTVTSLTNYSCTFCMAARPLIMVTPVPDTSETCASDPHFSSNNSNYICKFLCDIYYTNSKTSSKMSKFCGHFIPSTDFIKPPILFEPPQNVFIPSELNVTDCFISPFGTTDVGTVNASCKYLWDVRNHDSSSDGALLYKTNYKTTVKITKDCMTCRRSELVAKRPFVTSLQNPDQIAVGVWWLCGNGRLRSVLPQNWKGTCIRVKLIQETMIYPHVQSQAIPLHSRFKRSTHIFEDDSKVYIDAIGVPRGVPDQYKARNEIAAGFTSWIPYGSVIETNKNTAWINYIYYNQQRFVNFTANALKALGEQLHATSLMTWQNRIALDMLLAEKGGVCVMFGDACCTFIPNNTAADGSFTVALNKLENLADELEENAGTEISIFKWFESIFGKGKALLLSLMTGVIVALALLTLCGCCVIPCVRDLTVRTLCKSV